MGNSVSLSKAVMTLEMLICDDNGVGYDSRHSIQLWRTTRQACCKNATTSKHGGGMHRARLPNRLLFFATWGSPRLCQQHQKDHPSAALACMALLNKCV